MASFLNFFGEVGSCLPKSFAKFEWKSLKIFALVSESKDKFP